LENEGNKTHNFAELVITSCSHKILKYTHKQYNNFFGILIVQAEEENVNI